MHARKVYPHHVGSEYTHLLLWQLQVKRKERLEEVLNCATSSCFYSDPDCRFLHFCWTESKFRLSASSVFTHLTASAVGVEIIKKKEKKGNLVPKWDVCALRCISPVQHSAHRAFKLNFRVICLKSLNLQNINFPLQMHYLMTHLGRNWFEFNKIQVLWKLPTVL